MSRINLLPWREARRKELQNAFVMSLVVVAICGAAVWGVIHLYHTQTIEVKNTRINYIEQQIGLVDKKIEEIKALEEKKQRLLARMRAIEQLQGNRPLIVRLFDELIETLPEGITVNDLTQKGTVITVNGSAQSNARVSSLMRNLKSSGWLEKPDLKVIKEQKIGEEKIINSFTLVFEQIIPKFEVEE